MKLVGRSFNIVISVLLLSAAAFLVYVAVPYFGNKALIVRSGSMQPAIGVGDLVVVNARKPVAAPAPAIFPKYKVGDIVAFSGQKDTSTITTHRIVDIKAQDGKIQYVTKGDANDSPDSGLVAEDKILGKSAFKIAGLGRIFALAKTRDGFLALVMLPAILVIIFEVVNIIREIGNIRRKKHGSVIANNSSSGNILMRLLVPIVVGIMFFQESFASYADTEVSNSNLLQAAGDFSPNPSPSPSPGGGTLVINEVLPDSSCFQGNTEAQWIEIYNGFNVSVNPKNYKITDGTNTIDLVTANNLTIAPGNFLLLAHNNAIWNSCYSNNGVQTGNLGGNLNIDGGELHLIDTDGVTVLDVVRWNQAGDATPAQNESIERDPDGDDTAFGANFAPGDFVVRTIPQPGL